MLPTATFRKRLRIARVTLITASVLAFTLPLVLWLIAATDFVIKCLSSK